MYYLLIRFAIIAILLLLLFIVYRFVLKSNKKSIIFLIVLFVGSIWLLETNPIENYFYTFKTPEEAFNYSETGKISNVIDGDNSCIVVYSKNKSTHSFMPLIKASNGYKLAKQSEISILTSELTQKADVEIYCIKKADDYYISVISQGDESTAFSDSMGSDFKTVYINSEGKDYGNLLSYAYIDEYEYNNYQLYKDEKLIFSN